MDEDHALGFFLWSIVGFFVGIYLFLIGLKAFMKTRLIEDIPTSKINSLAAGLVEINGIVLPYANKLIKSPFTKRDCAYYKYTIEKKVSRHGYMKLGSGEGGVPFYLKDESGKVLINPNSAQVDIPINFELCSSSKDLPEELRQYLISKKIILKDFIIDNHFKLVEQYIEPNQKVYIMGTAGNNPFTAETAAEQGVEDMLIQKGKYNNIFYISDKSEQEVLMYSKIRSLGIPLGIALSLGCLYVILSFLKLL